MSAGALKQRVHCAIGRRPCLLGLFRRCVTDCNARRILLFEAFPDFAIAALRDAFVFVGAVDQRLGRFDFSDLAFDVGKPAIVEFALQHGLRVSDRTAPGAACGEATP